MSTYYYKDHYVAKLEADVESVKAAMIVVNMSIWVFLCSRFCFIFNVLQKKFSFLTKLLWRFLGLY